MFHASGGVEVIEEKDGLRIKLLPEGRAFLNDKRNADGTWEEGPKYIFEELFEHIRCNSSLDFIRPEEIAALTDAPIIGLDVDRGESGDKIETTGRVFWHERYAVECPLEILLDKGEIVLPEAPKA